MPTTLTDNFWKIIDDARAKMEDPMGSLDAEFLQQGLIELSDDEITVFMREFYQALINLNTWELWGAGYVIAGGMSDDGFHYFRSWIIGRGREAYDIALSAPDDLAPLIDDEGEVENEELEYVALEILEDRDLDDPREDSEQSPDDEPTGARWTEEEVEAKYPKLAAKFG